MTITRTQDGDRLTLAPEGRLDTLTAPEFEKELKDCMPSAQSLTLDMAKLDYISSAGLRAILWAYKTFSDKGGFKLINVNEIVKEVLDVTGFSDVLCIE
ncbi:MAG: STAS domain-containing protein [Clostridia bacterium]|nr:STAS domain-containing protein [Clostridia bacterium]MCR4577916.1 STAS domain-containing protein [Clostridiales bacterium]